MVCAAAAAVYNFTDLIHPFGRSIGTYNSNSMLFKSTFVVGSAYCVGFVALFQSHSKPHPRIQRVPTMHEWWMARLQATGITTGSIHGVWKETYWGIFWEKTAYSFLAFSRGILDFLVGVEGESVVVEVGRKFKLNQNQVQGKQRESQSLTAPSQAPTGNIVFKQPSISV